MTFVPFELERWQSTWEKRVRFNLSESGVYPLSIAELLELAGQRTEDLTEQRMGYNYSDGTVQLREGIAELYEGATADHVTVTVGSSEANFIVCWTLVEPGDHVVVVTPTYMQAHGLVQNFGARVSELWLHPDLGWEPKADEIAAAIRPETKLVVVTNPNNPTGHVLTDSARQAILDRVRETGAWLLADEVYQGAELNGRETKSYWGGYERAIVVNGLSKAYGLPGLRIGWVVSTPEFKDAVFRRHDYTVIGPGPAPDYLAMLAVRHREAVFARTRSILTTNFPLLDEWLRSFNGLFEWQRPECGAICLVRYAHSLSALELVDRVRRQHDILLVPGEHFLLPQHLRLGYGNERTELEEALELLSPAVRELLG
jgi:aspartate/methionine/tyrosine aminotransferase